MSYDSLAQIICEHRHNMKTYLSMAPMRKLRVPCCATYVAPMVRPDDEMVTLRVGRGGHMEIFEVPAGLLTKASRFFAEEIRERKVFFFPNDTTGLFVNFTSFLFYGNFFGPGIRQYVLKALGFKDLLELYVLANDLEVPSLRNAVLDAFLLRVTLDPEDLPVEMIREIYERTERNSSLRNLVVDIMVNMGNKEEVRRWGKRWPKKFLVDCLRAASEDGVVPFEGSDVWGWAEGYRREMCEMYHRHDEGEEKMGEDVEEDVDMEEEGEEGSKQEAMVYLYPQIPSSIPGPATRHLWDVLGSVKYLLAVILGTECKDLRYS